MNSRSDSEGQNVLSKNAEQNDEAAIMQAAKTDLTRFALLYERYVPRIYAYCERRVNDAQEAEDLTSLIFTRALAAIDTYRGGLVAAWLFRIAHNVVINYWESQQSRREVVLDYVEVEASAPEPFDEIARNEQGRHLRALLATLPADEQDMLELKLSGGLSSEEIGKAMGKSPSAIRVTLHRTLKRLRSLYRQYGEEYPT